MWVVEKISDCLRSVKKKPPLDIGNLTRVAINQLILKKLYEVVKVLKMRFLK